MTETHEIQLAQQRLERARAQDAARAPKAAVLVLEAIIPPRGAHPCVGRCGTVLELPGVCDDCARVVASQAIDGRLRSWLRTIPDRQRDVTWAALPDLRREDGGPRVAGKVEHLRARLEGFRRHLEGNRRGVVRGVAGSGKTTIAVAHLRARLDATPGDRVRFVASADLLRPETPEGGPSALSLALSADTLVLDDFGAELNNVRRESFELPALIAPGVRVICERFDRGRSTLVTTGFTQEQVDGLYGDRTARRLYEGAALIRLGGT